MNCFDMLRLILTLAHMIVFSIIYFFRLIHFILLTHIPHCADPASYCFTLGDFHGKTQVRYPHMAYKGSISQNENNLRSFSYMEKNIIQVSMTQRAKNQTKLKEKFFISSYWWLHALKDLRNPIQAGLKYS